MPDTRTLGEGLLEVEYPWKIFDFDAYRFDDVIALNPSEANDRRDVAFPADVDGLTGTLVAVVNQPPRMKFNPIDKSVRGAADAPAQGTELVLGTGTVVLRRRIGGGRQLGERTAIGLETPLDGAAVQSLVSVWVELQLRD